MIDTLALVAAASTHREYDSARMIADTVANTDLVAPDRLWRVLRYPLARVARAVAAQARLDALGPTAEPDVLRSFADDLDAAARELEREADRMSWREAKAAARKHPEYRAVFVGAMASAWRSFVGGAS